MGQSVVSTNRCKENSSYFETRFIESETFDSNREKMHKSIGIVTFLTFNEPDFGQRERFSLSRDEKENL